ncbi:hypothetical protein FXO37_27756 [Capsicum annuum]|nr:hypothetical protein FXO37_27756 [Capsicum annuum]
MPFVRTPIHKPIQTKVTLRGNRKDINRPDSKKSVPVQSPAPSSFSSKGEDGVVSKKVFDKFCEKVWQEFNDAWPSVFQEKTDIDVHEARDVYVAPITKSVDEFLDDVLRSIDLDSITKVNVEVEDEFKNKEGVIEMNVHTLEGHESEVNDVNSSKLDQQYKSAVHILAGVNVESNADQHLSDS